MKDRSNVLNFTREEPVACPSCGEREVTTSLEDEEFTYGAGRQAVALRTRVHVLECRACGFAFTDDRAEGARHEAVCRHLGVMTPAEVAGVRERYGMSRLEFSRVSKIGEASLARWEAGLLIQNGALDHLLFLLTFPENISRLTARNLRSEFPSNDESKPHVLKKSFRSIVPDDQMRDEASTFQLRRFNRATCTS